VAGHPATVDQGALVFDMFLTVLSIAVTGNHHLIDVFGSIGEVGSRTCAPWASIASWTGCARGARGTTEPDDTVVLNLCRPCRSEAIA
jgi:hypothetical protein